MAWSGGHRIEGMASFPTVSIDVVHILCAILHAILLHPLFGTVKPQTFDPSVADSEMELINEKVDMFRKGIESGSNKRGQVLSRRPYSFLSYDARDRHEFSATLTTAIINALQVMLTCTSSEKGHTIMVKAGGVEIG
ncbi:hypothetical protein OG21DRAFT_1477801 [Imleria badia]|nr:hypothetical protein OG21DRAFT_1477801 [Imleria badia]